MTMQQKLLKICQQIDVIPEELMEPLQRNLEAAKNFVRWNTQFAVVNANKVKLFIHGLRYGYKHHNLDCISFKPSLRTLCGFTLEAFAILFTDLESGLSQLFPNSPSVVGLEGSHYCERRFKLFLTLFHLKMGVSYENMSSIFGWCKSAIGEWCNRIQRMMTRSLDGFIHVLENGTLSQAWQRRQADMFKMEHQLKSNWHFFKERMLFQNRYQTERTKSPPFRFDIERLFMGSIGAVDGTYTVSVAFKTTTLNDDGDKNPDDAYYCKYLGEHGYKLLVLTSHKDPAYGNKKIILQVLVGPAPTSDAVMWDKCVGGLLPYLIDGVVFVGDNAFQDSQLVIAPYAAWHLLNFTTEDRAAAGSFNNHHSGRRIDSENCIGELKEWAIVRGRDDVKLFDNQDYFEDAIKCVWGLINYRTMKCPLMNSF